MRKFILLLVCGLLFSCGNEVSDQYIQKKYKDYRILDLYTRGHDNPSYYMVVCVGDTLKEVELPEFVYDLYSRGDTIGRNHVAPDK